MLQELVSGAAVAELAFNSELRYLLVRLASDSRKALETIQPNMGKLKSVAPPPEQVFGYIVTTATGAALALSFKSVQPCSHSSVPSASHHRFESCEEHPVHPSSRLTDVDVCRG
jgi:hypothetical protein